MFTFLNDAMFFTMRCFPILNDVIYRRCLKKKHWPQCFWRCLKKSETLCSQCILAIFLVTILNKLKIAVNPRLVQLWLCGTMKFFPDLGLCICESMNKISLMVLFLYFPTCQNNFPTSQNNKRERERDIWGGYSFFNSLQSLVTNLASLCRSRSCL